MKYYLTYSQIAGNWQQLCGTIHCYLWPIEVRSKSTIEVSCHPQRWHPISEPISAQPIALVLRSFDPLTVTSCNCEIPSAELRLLLPSAPQLVALKS
ncbi:hypothetical protein [Chamaesiphon minutus]|uniref:hypothetical protein n=1 Tax=Chamaesiphon minutus TaxID=1173032 RepID=UPI0018DED539|nr:hypothetical protein [Chamaesiphon minutus]